MKLFKMANKKTMRPFAILFAPDVRAVRLVCEDLGFEAETTEILEIPPPLSPEGVVFVWFSQKEREG